MPTSKRQEYYLKNKERIKERATLWRLNNPEQAAAIQQKYRSTLKAQNKARSRGYKYKYGLTLEEYNRLETEQNNVCAICGNPETQLNVNGEIKKLSVDHCHHTGEIRKLLCNSCNSLLGQCKDNIKILQNAIEYLKEFQ